MNTQCYYYQQMTEDEKRVYCLIRDGLRSHKKSIQVRTHPEMRSATDIYNKVLKDNPAFFYVSQCDVRYRHQNSEWIIYPKYFYSASEAEMMFAAMRRVVEKVVDQALKYRNDPFKMELFLHNSLVKSVAYDYEAAAKNDDSYHAYSIAGAFLNNKAVCGGIAEAFKFLCDAAGLPCMVVTGNVYGENIFPANSLHAWNLVNVEGQWYHVDVTWDAWSQVNSANTHSERHIKFDYFNLTTEEISVDHRPREVIPQCTAQKYNYFYHTGKYAENYGDMVRVIDQQINNERIRLRVSRQKALFSGSDAEKQMLDALQEVQKKRKTFYQYRYFFNEKLGIINLCRM